MFQTVATNNWMTKQIRCSKQAPRKSSCSKPPRGNKLWIWCSARKSYLSFKTLLIRKQIKVIILSYLINFQPDQEQVTFNSYEQVKPPVARIRFVLCNADQQHGVSFSSSVVMTCCILINYGNASTIIADYRWQKWLQEHLPQKQTQKS